MAQRSKNPALVRAKILRIATDEFGHAGFEGARVDRIADRCKVSKNMLYYYFTSKEGLFIAVLEGIYEDIRTKQGEIFIREDDDPRLAMAQIIEHTFAALETSPDAIRILNEENNQRGKFIRKSRKIRELYSPLVDAIGQILSRGSTLGIFREGLDPAVVYLTLSSLCYHYLSNQYTLEVALNKDLVSVSSRRQWVQHVTDLILLYCTSEREVAPSSPLRTRRLTSDDGRPAATGATSAAKT